MKAIVTCTAAALVLVSQTGCGGDTTGYESTLGPGDFFGELTLDHHAINLSTVSSANSVQLHASATFANGNPVPGTVLFSTDNTELTVSETGIITAHQPTVTPAIVRATLTYRGVTQRDSAYVAITETVPTSPLQTLSIQPPSGDSAKVAGGGFSETVKMLTVTTRTTTGDSMPGLLIAFRSSDTLTATVDQSRMVNGLRPGQVMLYATTYAYGVVKEDSLPFVLGQPLGVIVSALPYIASGTSETRLSFSPGTMTIGVGGNVAWSNLSNYDIDVVFDDSLSVGPASFLSYLDGHPGTGNIPGFRVSYDSEGGQVLFSWYSVRSFPKPGIFTYHSRLYDQPSGTIIVCDERVTLCPR